MKRTRFEIKINAMGPYLTDIVEIIASHNSGKVNIDIEIVASFVEAQRAKYLASACSGIPFLHISLSGDNSQTLKLSCDDKKTYYLELTEIEPPGEGVLN